MVGAGPAEAKPSKVSPPHPLFQPRAAIPRFTGPAFPRQVRHHEITGPRPLSEALHHGTQIRTRCIRHAANGLVTRTPRISWPSFKSSVYNTTAPDLAAATTTSASQNESFACSESPIAVRIAA